jgi:transcriptional regulator with XRE-family HTH domain
MESYAQEDTLTVHKLRTLRLERGLTQEDLAQAAGLSAGTVNRIERGPGQPVRPGTARRLAEALKVPVMQLTRCGPREESAA